MLQFVFYDFDLLTAANCLLSIVRKSSEHYFICTTDKSLSDAVRQLPAVPLVYINHKTVLLENPANTSEQTANKQAKDRLHNQGAQKDNLAALKLQVLGPPVEKEVVKRRRRGKKGPNPLSCKKKLKRLVSTPIKAEKKTRRKKRKPRQADATTTSS